jgi:hypothetical protein
MQIGKKLILHDHVVETREASLIGIADYLREEYSQNGSELDGKFLVVLNRETGEFDISNPLKSKTGPREKRSKSKQALLMNEKRRMKYRESRDSHKTANFPIVRQELALTKG